MKQISGRIGLATASLGIVMNPTLLAAGWEEDDGYHQESSNSAYASCITPSSSGTSATLYASLTPSSGNADIYWYKNLVNGSPPVTDPASGMAENVPYKEVEVQGEALLWDTLMVVELKADGLEATTTKARMAWIS